MLDINLLQTLSNLSLKEIIMHPLVFAMWTTSLLTMLVVFCKSIPMQFYNRIKRYLSISLTIDESDNVSGFDIFDSFNKWVITRRIEWLSRSFEVDSSKKIQSGQGFQLVWYKNSLFWVTMSRREPKGQNSFKTIGVYNIITAKWNKKKLEEMIAESCAYKDRGQIMLNDNDSARYDYPKYIKDQTQLISKKVYDRCDETFNRFVNDQEYYDINKLPYKESVLLWGPPGTGKTSLVRHLASKYNMNLVLMESGDLSAWSVGRYSKRSEETGIKTVILLEDITSNQNLLKVDETKVKKDEYGDTVSNTSLSKFLNTLDGAKPLDNVIIVMTTNHIHKLDSAVYRDGRVDHRICMDYMSFDDANDVVINWDSNDERAEYIKANLVTDKLSANAIMKLNALSKDVTTVTEKLKVIVEDNNNFMELSKEITIEEV